MSVKTWQEQKKVFKSKNKKEWVQSVIIGTLIFSTVFFFWYLKG